MILHLLNSYLSFNILLVVLYASLKASRGLNHEQRLTLTYLGLVLGFFALGLQPFLPRPEYLVPGVKLWSGKLDSSAVVSSQLLHTPAYVTLNSEASAPEIETGLLFQWIGLFLGGALVYGVFMIIRELRFLRKIEGSSFLLRRRKNVLIFISDSMTIPLSYRRHFKLITILPSDLLGHPEELRAALAHEFQHHRQGDTFWAYPLLILQKLCYLNPFAHGFVKSLHEIQEYACDEVLISQKKVDSDSYMSCLIRIAQTAVSTNTEPGCATGFCFSRQQNILKRRIENMNKENFIPGKKTTFKFFALGLMVLIAASAWASRKLIQDRIVTMEEAQALIKKPGEFPLVVNEQVLTQLNKYLGTPEGRNFMRDSLERKIQYAGILSEKAKQYGTPEELNAIPVVESGFINHARRTKFTPAGIWMFIPPTARRYGMKVNKAVDERLNVALETDGAHRYLQANQMLFQDWHLALLAYNIGEGAVQKAITKFKTRNAWELLEKGVVTDKNYLPSVMAAMIIMKNPELLKN